MTDRNSPVAKLMTHGAPTAPHVPITGVMTGRVERAEDGGQFRVRLFGMNGQSDDDLCAPARMMSPDAGNGRGFHFLPEEGDEVVCAFQGGNPNQPIILGGVWNRDNQPPSQAQRSTDNDVRTIVSRSGHEISLNDGTGTAGVKVRSAGGHQMSIDDASQNIQLRTASGVSLLLNGATGQIVLTSPTCSMDLAPGGALSIESTTQINLRAPIINIQGATVNVSGLTTIQGKPFLLHTHAGTPVDP